MLSISLILVLLIYFVLVSSEYSDLDKFNDTTYCEIPSVPKSLFDIVIAGYKYREPNEYSYLFGFTNANFYHYRRQFATQPLKITKEMCGVQIFEKVYVHTYVLCMLVYNNRIISHFKI
jgi:hypothetical protein